MAQCFTLASPGVYREDAYVRPTVELPTGLPGFVGFGGFGSAAEPRRSGPELIRHADELAAKGWQGPATGYLRAAVAGFFANGGGRCYVAGAAPDAGSNGLIAALASLGPLADLDLVAVPDAMMLLPDANQAQRVQRAALVHCALHGNRFGLLDGPRTVLEASSWRTALLAGAPAEPANAALYFGWLWPAGADSPIPPCGHVAGIVTRSDAQTGVFKAPANEEIRGVVDVDVVIDQELQKSLNPKGINCLRALPGRGIRVWGARTLSLEPEWRYVNVRRIFLTLVRWTERNMTWAPFEPNGARLWNRISRELTVYLERLWRAGALKGASREQAFFVKCDAETNPDDVREQGQVVTEIGLAPALPAEFVVVRIIQRPGTTALA